MFADHCLSFSMEYYPDAEAKAACVLERLTTIPNPEQADRSLAVLEDRLEQTIALLQLLNLAD